MLIVISFSSCGDKPFFEAYNTVDNQEWKLYDRAQFKFTVTDTVTKYDFLAQIRSTTDYRYNNLWFIFHLKHPNGIEQVDTIPMSITDNTGRWLGKNTGSLVTTPFALASSQSFKVPGEYIVEIEHVMQDSIIYNITDVGFSLYKSENQ